MKRIGLGTAQLGSKYGINNKIGVPSRTETEKILNICIDSEIDTIDTAMSYGNSEDNLGLHNLQHFKVVTKLKALPKDYKNIDSILDKIILKDQIQLIEIMIDSNKHHLVDNKINNNIKNILI